MTKKITKLTTSQETRLIEFREEWLKIGLCCEPADFTTGDEVIRGFYARLKKPSPIILHFSSPAICELAVNFIFMLLKEKPSQLWSQLGSQLESQLWSQLGSQLRSQLGSQLGSQLRSQLGSQLESQLWSQLRSQLRSQLGSQLGSQLWSQLWSQLGSQLGSQLRSQLWSPQLYFRNNSFGGQHWCAWEAFYLFGHEIGVTYKAEDIALLLEWARQSQSIGWWAPWDGICFVSDRPRLVKFDAEKRFHNETGKSVEYSDGWGVSSWHGVQVPDEWIVKKQDLTPKVALTWKNIEQRRAACEIIGWERILHELNAKTIDKDGDPEIGELVEVELPEIGKEKFLRVVCGTKRSFALPVPPNMKTALEANAWTFGLDKVTFVRPEVRT